MTDPSQSQGRKTQAWKDDVAECLAAFTVASPSIADDALLAGAQRILADTIAVGLGAFGHPAAHNARRYLGAFANEDRSAGGSVVWGTQYRASFDRAAFVNGVLLRCYDYNDVLVARKGAGHPSDMIAALIAVCEWRDLGGLDLLQAIALGYEVAEALHDVVAAEAAGWDHANVSALGATCAIARLLDLSHDETVEALGIAAVQHIQSNEIESSVLNRRGDLTMWKRFHGADVMRYALDACLLAVAGAESAVRPFRGKLGFLNIFAVSEDPAPYLARRLTPGGFTGAVNRTNLKRWPVGSRAQSAIASAIDARNQAGDEEISAVRVRTGRDAYDHLVGIRQDPWRPISRETADHSLPYIVGTAVLDGFVNVASFNLDKVSDSRRASFIAERVDIRVDDTLNDGPASSGWHLSEVEVQTAGGRLLRGAVKPGPGHHDNLFTQDDMRGKLLECAEGVLNRDRTEKLFGLLCDIRNVRVRELAANLLG